MKELSSKLLKVVKTEQYISYYYTHEKNSLYLRHIRSNKTILSHFEVWPRMWMFSFGKLGRDQVKVRTGHGVLELEGNVAAFVPPCSLMEWLVSPGLFESEAIFSVAPLPSFVPDHAVCIRTPEFDGPPSIEQIINLLAENANAMPIDRFSARDVKAKQIKQMLDGTFEQKVLISSIANRLGMSRVVMSRIFKRAYGLSMQDYRSRLRVSKSATEFLFPDAQPKKISEVGLDCGFEELSQFYKQFRRFLESTPKQYYQ